MIPALVANCVVCVAAIAGMIVWSRLVHRQASPPPAPVAPAEVAQPKIVAPKPEQHPEQWDDYTGKDTPMYPIDPDATNEWDA